ncbi:MAG: hypothetical protein OXG65_09900 [Chloroflexi bacterium]|nr:hypothetical protein [Chloroflexota bacterium]
MNKYTAANRDAWDAIAERRHDIWLVGNGLTGCVPVGLVVGNWAELGLPDCGAGA